MERYPLTAKYDEKWISDNWMGPHPLWLLEDICRHMDIQPGMKVLDMGCGKGLTSVFLAREFGVTVFANDLWIRATDNLHRFEAAGVAGKVFPIHAEAHELPYAEGFFDVAISIDSYQYYGTCDTYFPAVFHKLVKPGGQYGIVVPGLKEELENGCPETLKEFWEPEMYTFHSKEWWRNHWEKTGLVAVSALYEIDEPKAHWYPWAHWAKANLQFNDKEFLDADVNGDLALIAMVARRGTA